MSSILLYFLTFALLFIPMTLWGVSQDSGASEITVDYFGILGGFFFLFSYIPMFIAWFYVMFQQYFMYPAMIYLYTKKQTISTMLKVSKIWDFIKKNFINLLLYAAILFGVGLVFTFIVTISSFLIILCIGIFILPIVLVVGITYFTHVQAHLLGQLCKLDK